MNLDEEILAHWAKYVCVLTSGFVENSMRMILQDYVKRHANSPVVNFVDKRIEGLTNLNDDKIAQLLGSFNPNWREKYLQTRTSEQKDAIDSVVANRHLIAHGRSVGITLSRMKNFYNEIVRAVKIIDEVCVNYEQ
ncbi:MAG: hypothetical protein HY879_13095 [Deltaproteobacteria bacterium]|nr:hypothetical protein [Deltaproteobacteria bacterium]